MHTNMVEKKLPWSEWAHLTSLNTAIVWIDLVSEQSCRICSWTGRGKPTQKLNAHDGLPFNPFRSEMSLPIHSTRSCDRVAETESKTHFIPLFSGNSYPNDREAPSATAARKTLPDPAPKSTSSLHLPLKPEELVQDIVVEWIHRTQIPPSAPSEIFLKRL